MLQKSRLFKLFCLLCELRRESLAVFYTESQEVRDIEIGYLSLKLSAGVIAGQQDV